ncbi:poly(ADP-ribose) polymerase [Trypanosoma grayi]|uniref:poly(ADP-ribose) polymerase n=1 Tax=Trypanosoma grayi TaxID=71804 RepID=UPI0004F4ABB2|nr:poly(ADP-ribose) polymerase [Trypanosoma grayi]KEG07014.1 poly(ADP-ribose) polymerase [Trypanosoma grayi]
MPPKRAPAPATKKAPPKRAPAPATKKAPPKKTPAPATKKAPSKKAPAPSTSLLPAVAVTTVTVAAPPSVASTAAAGVPAGPPIDKTGGKRQRLLQKGRGVVDAFSGKVDTCHVYEDGGDLYQCTLNQTNISSNNNKYYILQLLEADSGGQYYVFTRWGRVGLSGQHKTELFSSTSAAVQVFCKTFYSKTHNRWEDRANFKKIDGRYYLMDIEYGAQDAEEKSEGVQRLKKKVKEEAKEMVVGSALPKEVQELMRLIGCKDTMTRAMKELEINTEQMPLGKISKPQILRAYEVLKAVEAELQKPEPQLEALSGQFYTLIPHVFGNRKPPVIGTLHMLKNKMEMLEVLGELEIAAKLLDTGEGDDAHPLDRAYKSLKCDICPLPHDDAAYKRIVEYARNTQGSTHNSYNLDVMEVFMIRREGEEKRYEAYKKLGNRQMLWHGSRVTNFMGILSQGLRIAPPEAPCTGYMFGKGIYLADVCSKSANYCHPEQETDVGVMLLCEAALGTQKEYYNAHYMEKPQPGTSATKGVGRMYPDPAGAETVDGVLWPKGCMRVDDNMKTSLIYPEHIVYDVGQCIMRYLVLMKFRYN